jgi:uncharacterized Zn finger protein
MSFNSWGPYVSVAQRRKQAATKLAKMRKKGQTVDPVIITGRTIASSFWGKAWCTNLERYSDFESRLPRGRSYVRNGSVLDLKITKGKVAALIWGSDLYRIRIGIAPVTAPRWSEICKDCSGSIDSVVELLQGRIDKSVMDRVCRQDSGLFPAPDEIELSCDCPDWADMCKHVAAALYGIGARLDQRPELLFVLRRVDEKDLIASAGRDLTIPTRKTAKGKVLVEDDLAALFGLDMADAGNETGTEPAIAKKVRKVTAVSSKRSKAAKAKTPKSTAGKSSKPKRIGSHRKKAAPRSSAARGSEKGAAPNNDVA